MLSGGEIGIEIRRRRVQALVTVFALVASQSAAAAHRTWQRAGGSGCHAPDAGLTLRLEVLKLAVSGTDSTDSVGRRKWNLPTLPSDSVTAVTDSTICQRAALAFGRSLSVPDTITSRQVYVVRIGPTRYVVGDPTVTKGEFDIYMVFDSSFTTKLAE